MAIVNPPSTGGESSCNAYNTCQPYCPPVGRLPVLGKVRAEIDHIRTTIADLSNQMTNRDAATADNHYKIYEDASALRQKTQAEVNKINKEIQQITEAIVKSAAETLLLKQKAITELAQTSDTVVTGVGLNYSSVVTGIVAKQKGLFQKQTDGFDRDAEQKLAKIMVDTWSVRQTTDEATASTAGLDDAEIASVLSKAKAGI